MLWTLPNDMLASAIEMLCYVFSMGAVLISFLFTLK